MIPTFKELSEKVKSNTYKSIFSIIASKYEEKGLVTDSASVNYSLSEINEIKDLQYEQVKANYAQDSIAMQSLEDCHKEVIIDIKKRLQKQNDYTKDGFYNPIIDIGTLNDPGSYNSASIPVSLTPNEASAYYSNKGIGQLIIDKKCKVPFLNGYQFTGLSPDDNKKLLDHAIKRKFDKYIIEAMRDSLIFGGSVLLPVFKKDSYENNTYQMSEEELMKAGVLDADCIDYFFTADRWNTVMVPSYDITSRDYLNPKSLYIPLGSMKVNTERTGLFRLSPMPYWSAIHQLGWSISDFEGYIRSLIGYNIIIASIPIMAQQMSLIIHEMPLDGIIAQNGKEYAQEFIRENESQLAQWSMTRPKALNSFGKLSVIERTYTGFKELIETYREHIAANAHIPVSGLWYLQPKGISAGNAEDITIKQSESVQIIERESKDNVRKPLNILVIDCFGANSEQAAKRNQVEIEYSSPVPLSDTAKAANGVSFTQMITNLVTAGMPLDMAIKSAQQFIDFDITPEDYERLQVSSELPNLMNGLNNSEQDKNLFKKVFDSVFKK